MMERVELDFEADEGDVLAGIELMIADLKRLEHQYKQTADAADNMGARVGKTWRPGGAGGGGQWVDSGAFAMGPAGSTGGLSDYGRQTAALNAQEVRLRADELRSKADSIRSLDEETRQRDRDNRSFFRRILNLDPLPSGGGSSGRGGDGRSALGGLRGRNDGIPQPGDLVRGILPGAGRAGPGALGLLAGGAAGLSETLLPAALGVGVGAAADIGVLGVNVAALALAFHGLGTAIGGDAKAYQELLPYQKEFVDQVRSYIPFIDKLQATVSKGILPGAEKGLRAALSPAMQGALQTGLGNVGSGLGDQFEKIGKFVGSDEQAGKLERFLTNSVGWTDSLTNATLSLFDALTSVLDAGAPFITWMNDGIEAGAEWVDQFTHAKIASGEFVDYLDRGETVIQNIGDALGSLLGFLKAVADTMDGPVGLALSDLGDGLDSLAQTISDNQDKIASFIDGGINALAWAIQNLWPVITTTLGFIDDIVNAVGDWELAFKFIIAGVLLTKLADLAIAIQKIGTVSAVAAGEEGVGLLITRLGALRMLGPIAIPIVMKISADWLFNKGGGDFDAWSTKIAGQITDALPLPQGVKDWLKEGQGGQKFDPATGKPVTPAVDVSHEGRKGARGAGRGPTTGSTVMPGQTPPKKGTPPPFDTNISGDALLTYAEREALAAAQATGDPAKITAVTNKIIDRLRDTMSKTPQGPMKAALAEEIATLSKSIPSPTAAKSGTDLLTFSEREQIAGAKGTPGNKDDANVLKRVIKRLTGTMAGLPQGDLRANVAEEIATLKTQLASALHSSTTGLITDLEREQLAIAQRTPGTKDDVSIRKQIIKRLFGELKGATGGLRADIQEEISKLQKEIDGITQDVNKAIVDAVNKLLNSATLADKIDKAQSAVLGTKHVSAFGEGFAEHLRAILHGNNPAGGKGPVIRGPLHAMAEGGIASRPTLALIGERGPEAVIPLGSAAARGMMGGGTEVHVQIADAMSWLRDFIDVQIEKATDDISYRINERTDERVRGGRF